MLRGNLIALYNFLRRRNVKGGAGLFCLVNNDMVLMNGTKMYQESSE